MLKDKLIFMSEEKDTLKIIDGAIKAVKEIPDVLKTAKDELINIENERDRLEKEKTQLEQEKKKLEQETRQLAQEKQERDEKIGAMTEDQMKLLDEYKKVKVELTKFAKITAEMDEAEFNFDRIKALLSIYTVLIEKIWQGQPHYRILLTLHGDKEEMTRDEIKNTTGIVGAFVIRAVHELANVDLLQIDEDSGLIKLKQRLFEKEALAEKK